METKTITMTNGGKAVVDADDYDRLLSRTWYQVKSRQSFYAKTGKNERMHRMILGVSDKSLIVDHINGDGMDNRKSNLRIVSTSENVQNRQNSRSGNRCPGVYMDAGKWRATVTVNYKKITIGFFADEDDAINAVNKYREFIGRPRVSIAGRSE